MSSYAVTDDGTLLVTWRDGASQVAKTICTNPAARVELLDLTAALTGLSEQCWRIYLDPVRESDFPGSQPEDDRTHLVDLVDVVARQQLPAAAGYLIASYIPVVWAAEQVGRTLEKIDAPDVRSAVLAEVRTESQAVLAADLGDFRGRARQAVLHSRSDASPAQVDAASQYLATNPFGGPELFSDYDPTAACVAAATWFLCAAQVAGEELGCSDLRDVVRQADDIEAIEVTILSSVLTLLQAEVSSAHAVVARLVQEARAVAAGQILDFAALEREIAATHELAARVAAIGHDEQPVFRQLRLCQLDPSRPAPNLLEALLGGIDGCWQVWDEEVDAPDLDDDLSDDLDAHDDGGGEEAEQERRDGFADLVREWMASGTGR